MDASDWEPLPAEQLGLHPGEEVDLGHDALDSEPVVPRPRSERPHPFGGGVDGRAESEAQAVARARALAELDPKQARALAALQKKMAAAPKTRSFVDELASRQHKQQRRRRAAKATDLADLAQLKCAVTVADIPLAVDYAVGTEGRDSREDEAWFKQLPAGERERLHAQWARQREQSVAATVVHRRNRGRRAISALLIFAATCVLGMPSAWPVLILAGIVCSIIWSYIAPCRYRDPIVALVCLVVMTAVVWVVNGAEGMPRVTFMDAILLAVLAALVGFDAEIRRTGGFDSCR